MIDFRIAPDGQDEYPLTAGARDIVQWEKTTKGKTFKSLMETMSMVDLYALAWHAARRQKMFSGTLAEFEQTVELNFSTPDPEVPTLPDQSTDS